MDTLGKVLLSDIHKHELMEGSIIAGGYVRDHILSGPFKDIDIFVPCKTNKVEQLKDCIRGLDPKKFSEIKFFQKPKYKAKVGYIGAVADTLYMGHIPVQFIIHKVDEEMDNKEFSDHIFKDFDFGINQVSFDGQSVYKSEQFNSDVANNEATLLEIHDNMENFIAAVSKFSRLKEKYPYLRFKTIYKLVDPRKEGKEKSDERLRKVQYYKNGIYKPIQHALYKFYDDNF